MSRTFEIFCRAQKGKGRQVETQKDSPPYRVVNAPDEQPRRASTPREATTRPLRPPRTPERRRTGLLSWCGLAVVLVSAMVYMAIYMAKAITAKMQSRRNRTFRHCFFTDKKPWFYWHGYAKPAPVRFGISKFLRTDMSDQGELRCRSLVANEKMIQHSRTFSTQHI